MATGRKLVNFFTLRQGDSVIFGIYFSVGFCQQDYIKSCKQIWLKCFRSGSKSEIKGFFLPLPNKANHRTLWKNWHCSVTVLLTEWPYTVQFWLRQRWCEASLRYAHTLTGLTGRRLPCRRRVSGIRTNERLRTDSWQRFVQLTTAARRHARTTTPSDQLTSETSATSSADVRSS